MPGASPLKPRTALFRCDASPEIGGGHVMRCLTLAGELQRRGCAVTFAVAPPTRRTVRMLDQAGVELVEVDRPVDATELKARLDRSFDLAVVDHYELDATYETALRESAGTILVIDDLADRPHDCDVLLDQTYGRDAADYAAKVPSGCRVLAGAQYALLRQEFATLRPRSLERRRRGGPARRLFVSLGMTDVGGMTQTALSAALAAGPDLLIDVMLGSVTPGLTSVHALAAGHDRVAIHVDPPNPAELMLMADLAIGAAGSTTWERCCLGLPSLTMVLAPNQREICRNLSDEGAILVIDDNTQDGIVRQLVRLKDDVACLRGLSERSSRIADGRGAELVVDALSARTSAPAV